MQSPGQLSQHFQTSRLLYKEDISYGKAQQMITCYTQLNLVLFVHGLYFAVR